jgi:phospholipid/cholesterol/gamma-HCH transport system ATP-binding protein
MMTDRTLFKLDHVSKSFGARKIIDQLCWELNEGDCAVILGPSGGGKSVFLNTLLRFLEPDEGEVFTPGRASSDDSSSTDRRELFDRTAVMFQEDALLEDRTVEANLAIALRERADLFKGPFDEETETRINSVLEEVQLGPAVVRRSLPSMLSGGMRRRIALARALIRLPEILIADEPTTGLDPSSASKIYELLGSLIKKRNMSAIIISHDPSCASRLGNPVYYFSPVEGTMPRWPGGPGTQSNQDERHKDLLFWMDEQTAAHVQRNEDGQDMVKDSSSLPAGSGLAALFNFTGEAGRLLDDVGRFGLLLGRLKHRPRPVLLIRNLMSWGLGSLPLCAVIFLMIGMVMELSAESAVVELGFSNELPSALAEAMLRLSPILTGFLLAGRCGSAICARIGWMQLSGQNKSLFTQNLDPDEIFFPPLFWSLVIAAPVLTLAGIFLGAAGAVLLLSSPLSHANITTDFFLDQFPSSISWLEYLVVIIKGILIGGGIILIAYSGGISNKRSPSEVSGSITRGLVLAFLWIVVIDFIMSFIIPA